MSIPLKSQQQPLPPQQIIPNWGSSSVQQPHVQQSSDTGNNKLPYSNVNQLHQLQAPILINNSNNNNSNNSHLPNGKNSVTQETFRHNVQENLIYQSKENSQKDNVSGPQNNDVNRLPVNGDRERSASISLNDGREYGSSSVEIINKLKLLKNEIELGLHPRIRPPKSSWVPQFPYYKITNENNSKTGTKAPRSSNEAPKGSGHFNDLVENKNEDSKVMQKSKNLPFESFPTEDIIGNRPLRTRRNRSPLRLAKEEMNFDYYHSPDLRMEKYHRSRSSRSPSPRRGCSRGFPEFSSTSRPVNEFDERFCPRNPGIDYREKYCSRNLEYEDYYSKHIDRQPERGGYQNLYRMRSRSPPLTPHPRRGNGWYGDEMYDERDYRTAAYYDRSFPPRTEVERSYGERDEFISRRRW